MQVLSNRKLVIKTKFPARITETIPESKVVNNYGDGRYEVSVTWDFKEAMILTKLNVKNVPSPITRDYKWPRPMTITPFEHQKETASFLSLRKRAFCFNEQGTGKTASVVWAADYLMNIGAIKRVLIVCPLSIMQSAWQQDLFQFAVHRTVDIAYGSADKRNKIASSTAEFVVINYDGIPAIAATMIDKNMFDLVVIDECFVAGTLVATPLGRRPIEQLEAGDKVLTSDGVMRIKRLVCNTAKHLVEVKLGNGKTIRCTPDHPLFTDAGWVCAKNIAGRRLISGAELSCLRAGISPYAIQNNMGLGKQHTNWVDLLKILCAEELALSKPQQERVLQLAARAAGQTERAENTGTSCKTIGGSESGGTQTEGTWGQRHGDGPDGATDFRGLTCGVGMELPHSVGQEATRLSYELQARLCVASPETGAGGRRGQSHICGTPSAGSEEGSKTGGAWVAGVTHIECPDGEAVYNLEVEGTPNYFVGDHWLVHNCNAYKNVQTKRWKLMRKLVRDDSWLWLLTGTPAAQSPLDAYGLGKLCVPSRAPRFFGDYRESVMQQFGMFRWEPRPEAEKIVFEMLQPAIRFTKAECLDLPPVTHVTRIAPLSVEQRKYYKELKDQLLLESNGEEVSAVNAAAKMSKLLQISGGAVYTDTGSVVHFDVSSRLKVIEEVIDEASHKVIVFVPFRHTIEMLQKHLTKAGITNEVIHGDVSVRNRTDIFKKFQEQPNPRVLVVQPAAAAHGVTLTAANVIIWYAPVTSTETYLQANARIDRPGQRNPMTVVHIQGSPVENRLYSMLQGNINNHEKLIDLYKKEMAET